MRFRRDPGLDSPQGGRVQMGAAHAPSVEGQPWVLVSGVGVPQDVAVVRPSAVLENGTIGGTTGCNRYTARYTIDEDSVVIGPIVLTRMACPLRPTQSSGRTSRHSSR